MKLTRSARDLLDTAALLATGSVLGLFLLACYVIGQP